MANSPESVDLNLVASLTNPARKARSESNWVSISSIPDRICGREVQHVLPFLRRREGVPQGVDRGVDEAWDEGGEGRGSV